MTIKKKLITVGVCLVILILGAGVSVYKPKAVKDPISNISELSGKVLCGVTSRMPESSAKIMFESITGQKLAGYNAYSSPEAVISALKSGKAASAWFLDVSARYLTETDESLIMLEKAGMSDITNLPGERFELGIAVRNDKDGEALKDELDAALKILRDAGRLEALGQIYIEGAADAEKFTEKDMVINRKSFIKSHDKKELHVGITGAVPPVELIGSDGKVYGFCAALMDEIGQYCGRSVEFEVLSNETVFSALMSGRIDCVFCYGTGNITTEGSKKWLTTTGYYSVDNYEFLTVAGE